MIEKALYLSPELNKQAQKTLNLVKELFARSRNIKQTKIRIYNEFGEKLIVYAIHLDHEFAVKMMRDVITLNLPLEKYKKYFYLIPEALKTMKPAWSTIVIIRLSKVDDSYKIIREMYKTDPHWAQIIVSKIPYKLLLMCCQNQDYQLLRDFALDLILFLDDYSQIEQNWENLYEIAIEKDDAELLSILFGISQNISPNFNINNKDNWFLLFTAACSQEKLNIVSFMFHDAAQKQYNILELRFSYQENSIDVLTFALIEQKQELLKLITSDSYLLDSYLNYKLNQEHLNILDALLSLRLYKSAEWLINVLSERYSLRDIVYMKMPLFIYCSQNGDFDSANWYVNQVSKAGLNSKQFVYDVILKFQDANVRFMEFALSYIKSSDLSQKTILESIIIPKFYEALNKNDIILAKFICKYSALNLMDVFGNYVYKNHCFIKHSDILILLNSAIHSRNVAITEVILDLKMFPNFPNVDAIFKVHGSIGMNMYVWASNVNSLNTKLGFDTNLIAQGFFDQDSSLKNLENFKNLIKKYYREIKAILSPSNTSILTYSDFQNIYSKHENNVLQL